MAIREILHAPDPRLKTVSVPVERVDDALRALMDDMLETMYAADGIGLAAIQVGVPKRVIVMDLDPTNARGESAARFFVNPVITWASDETALYEEGCLSVPEIYDEVRRPARIRADYLDYDGELRTLEADGLLATCLQHEMDHLEGVLFIDHFSKLKRDMMLRRLKKLQRAKQPA